MVCCTLIAALLGLLVRPLLGARTSPLAWRLEARAEEVAPAFGHSRWQSFRHAFAGLDFVVRNEANMRLHLGAAVAAVALGLLFPLDASEWRWLILAIALVMTMETVNTAIEQACNAITRAHHPAIKAAKDIAAGAVLICAMFASLIGASVFVPHFAQKYSQNWAVAGQFICKTGL